MLHPRFTTGVVIRFGLVVLLLPLLAVLGGCSVFGIATKGNLEDLADRQMEQHQQLQSQVAESEQKLDSRVTRVEDKTRRLDQDLVRYESEIQSAKLQLQSIKLDIDAFEDDLDRAATDSKQALRIQHEAIISERDRLRQRLNEIDALILSWEEQRAVEPEGTVTPVPGGLIIPEKPRETQDSADATQASSETTVWKKRRGAGN